MKIPFQLFYRLFSFAAVLTTTLFISSPAGAAEIALLAGYQTNSNLEISTSSQWPPGNLPELEPGASIDLEEGSSWAVAINTDFNNNPNQKVGIYYSQHNTEFDSAAGLTDSSLDTSIVHFTGTSIYPQSEKLAFFVVAGIGASIYDPADATLKKVTQFSAQIGTGANFNISENLLFQVDARWLPTFFNGKTAIFCNGGCTITVSSNTFSQFQMNAGLLFRF